MLAAKRFIRPPQNIYRHLYFHGVFTVKTGKYSFRMLHLGSTFENDIFWQGVKGAWEYQSILVWERMALKSDVIMDVGANSGFYSLVSKAVNPSSTVYAFEPLSRNAEILKANINLNGFNTIVKEFALSDKSGEQIIYDIPEIPNNRQASISNVKVDGKNARGTMIKTKRLDDFIIENQIESLDLIKIDVEEHEVEVLSGFKENINKFKPAILIEVLNNEIGLRIYNILSEFGYNYFLNISEQHGPKHAENLSPKYGRNFYCFIDKAHYDKFNN